MLLKIILGVFGVVLIILGCAALQPKDYKVSRQIQVNAAPDKIFPYINNRTKVNAWNSWLEFDPTAKITTSGPEEGVDSKTSWTDGEKLGTGSATVLESVPNQHVNTQLEYIKPFEAVQLARIEIQPSDGGSVVTWSVTGENKLFGRVMCLFMNMDKMIGGMFEKGLSKLKATVEAK